MINQLILVAVNVTRVVLSEYAGIPGSDYINANFIKGASGSPAYIASQGPLPNTVNDFWRMVVECEVQVIVMACNAEEAGKVNIGFLYISTINNWLIILYFVTA